MLSNQQKEWISSPLRAQLVTEGVLKPAWEVILENKPAEVEIAKIQKGWYVNNKKKKSSNS